MPLLDKFNKSPYAARRIVVADLDEESVRLIDVRAGRGESLSVAAAVEADFPPDLDPSDAAALGRFLGSVRERMGVEAGPSATAFPSHQAGWHLMNLPSAPEHELWPMALMQARRDQHLDRMAVEFCVLPPRAEPLRVLAAAVHVEFLDRTRTALAEAGCPPAAIGLRPQALQRAWKGSPALAGSVVIADVGRLHTEVLLSVDGSVRNCRSAPAGWGHFDAALQEAPLEDQSPEAPEDPDRWMSAVALEIRRTVFARSGRDECPAPQRLLLSAPGEFLPALAARLSADLGLEVVAADPAAGLDAPPAVAEELRRGNHAAAVGLARQFLIDRDVPVDYLRPKVEEAERRESDRVRTTRLAVALAAVVVALAPGILYKLQSDEVAGLRADLESRTAREKKSRGEIEMYKVFREIWSDKPPGQVSPAMAAAVAEERKKYDGHKKELADARARKEELARLQTPYAAADKARAEARNELESLEAKAADRRRLDAAYALGEVFAACEEVFGSARGGGAKGYLTEFRVEPPTTSVGGPGAGGRYRVVVKGRAEASSAVLAFEDALNAMGEAQTIRQAPLSRGADRYKVEFETAYRPSFLPKLPSVPRPAAKPESGRRR
jgi:Tfp pilus assembly PilM family ATPase